MELKHAMEAKEAARYIGASYWSLMQMIKRREIPFLRHGRKIVCLKESLDEWLKQKEQEAAAK